MQYESIILELLTRVKKLEEEVEQLKQQLSTQPEQDAPVFEDEQTVSGGYTPTTTYKKTTDEMIDLCYLCGKKLHAGEDLGKLADGIEAKTGMNRNSAIMYMQAVDALLSGTVYKRAINAKAAKKYLDNIHREYGAAGLERALKAARLHINYRKSCGLPCDYYEAICAEYERK